MFQNGTYSGEIIYGHKGWRRKGTIRLSNGCGSNKTVDFTVFQLPSSVTPKKQIGTKVKVRLKQGEISSIQHIQ